MSDELFSPSEVASDSPKLRWMKRHGITLYSRPTGDKTDAPNEQWLAMKGWFRAYGPDEDSALIDLAEMLDIADWREENL